jgi:alpha-tubulin suppressor-like RCC1 family protein
MSLRRLRMTDGPPRLIPTVTPPPIGSVHRASRRPPSISYASSPAMLLVGVCSTRGSAGRQVVETPSEQERGRVDRWHEHAAVLRPPEPRRPAWPALIVLACSAVLGSAALGLLDLIAQRSHDPHVLSGGVAVLVLGGIGLGVVLLSPLPISPNLRRARSKRHPDPLATHPLMAPGLVVIAFVAPAVFLAVAQIASGGGATGGPPPPKPLGPMQNVVSVALDPPTTLAVTRDGRLWTWGDSMLDVPDTVTPYAVPGQSGWVAVTTASASYLLLKRDGTLYGWTIANSAPELGLGSEAPHVPARIGDARWAMVAGGDHFTVAIQKSGTLWTCGDNDSGQLGLGDSVQRDRLTQVGSSFDWTTVACGNDFVVALQKDGTLWAWGDGESGELGLGDSRSRNVPTQVGSAHDWAAVSCGDAVAMAIKRDGSLWAWGDGESGELGLGDARSRSAPTRVGSGHDWETVACGAGYAVATKKDGTLWAWGAGLANNPDVSRPSQVGSANDWQRVFGQEDADDAAALKKDGTLWTWGFDTDGDLGLGAWRIPENDPHEVDLYPAFDPEQSRNWAGYETDDATASGVRASWSVPRLTSPLRADTAVSFWVGLYDPLDHQLVQVGVVALVRDRPPAIYRGWYEIYSQGSPRGSIHVMTAHPGDLITASVASIGHNRFRLRLADDTTGRHFAITKSDPLVHYPDAVVIAELPKRSRAEPHVSKPFALAAFGPFTFTGCRVDGTPLGRFSLLPIEMIGGGSGVAGMAPSHLDGNSTSFTVSEPQLR